MPHTFIIIFFVVLFAVCLTMFIPLGQYETQEITYMQNGAEKTRSVLNPFSLAIAQGIAGIPVMSGAFIAMIVAIVIGFAQKSN